MELPPGRRGGSSPCPALQTGGTAALGRCGSDPRGRGEPPPVLGAVTHGVRGEQAAVGADELSAGPAAPAYCASLARPGRRGSDRRCIDPDGIVYTYVPCRGSLFIHLEPLSGGRCVGSRCT